MLHVSFSHSGKWLASASKDTTVIIWDTEDINDVRKHRGLHGHPFSVAWVTWSPDDRYLIACGEDDSSEVFVWTAEVRQRKLCTRVILKCNVMLIFTPSLYTYTDGRIEVSYQPVGGRQSNNSGVV